MKKKKKKKKLDRYEFKMYKPSYNILKPRSDGFSFRKRGEEKNEMYRKYFRKDHKMMKNSIK